MSTAGWILLLLSVGVFLYAYGVYPLAVGVLGRLRNYPLPAGHPSEWPELTIVLPVYNEERALGGALETLLALDYPPHRRHILVVSDASTDRSDEIAGRYASRGVTLLRLPRRSGKTAAENAAASMLRGELVVGTDATTRILPASLKALVRVFTDSRIGLASGNNVSVGSRELETGMPGRLPGASGESAYVGYEMGLRRLETRMGSIVGASGCFYATRRSLYDPGFPPGLSRDFAAALQAAEQGYRAVLVPDAVCLVPRAGSLRVEFRRKVRTMTRGLATLWSFRRMMNPIRHPLVAFMLFGHKLARWVAILTAPLLVAGLSLLVPHWGPARWALAILLLATLLGLLSFAWPDHRRPPLPLAQFGYLVGSVLAGLLAWVGALQGRSQPIWEPTRRD